MTRLDPILFFCFFSLFPINVGVGASSFPSPLYPVLCFFYIYFYLYLYFLITSLHLSFGVLICRCPPTSIFHVLITTSSAAFLSTWPNHLSRVSLIFSCTYVCHTRPCSYFSIPHLLNPLYSQHLSQYSHFCSF